MYREKIIKRINKTLNKKSKEFSYIFSLKKKREKFEVRQDRKYMDIFHT